ncbi:TcpQ domain-containing protein [Verticiella sediminum]|uniref:TcpQ domain-containing protein n=1 Tax=Verticiella sediminum TaxID=1247510 RepID=UPI001FE9BCF7|nr:TcpQ domain-containing protein [Verticiella sediminum]
MGCWLLGACVGSGAAQAYDFAYQLSGDRRVAPVQVFDDGASTWLQFTPGQALPAIFDLGREGQAGSLLSYVQQGPYVVLNGTTGGFLLRIGDVTARAEYRGGQPRKGIVADQPSPSTQWVDTPPAPLPARGRAGSAGEDIQAAGFRVSSAERAVSVATVNVGAPGGPAAPAAETPPAGPQAMTDSSPAPVLEFDAALSEGNMRRVLERWSRQAGWMFGPEHWTVDVDIPLVGAASFGADFRNAVRGLLSATELTERPLQPCFYANRVVRVVAYTQPCDVTLAPGGDAVRAS